MILEGPTHTFMDTAKLDEYWQELDASELDEYWQELINTVRRCWEYGIHANDLTLGEIEEDISFALSRFAEATGLPVPDWDEEYVEEDADD